MRITLKLDHSLAAELKRRASESKRSFEEVVNEAIRAGLEQGSGRSAGQSYSVPAHEMGRPRPGIDLDKGLALAGALEDAEIARKN